jgi:molybdopterin-guanine dinucleotide biosynthesis protein A
MNGFVLAGGRSTRMGRDKALLEFEGRPLIARIVDLLRSLDLTPRICGSRPDLAGFAEVVADNYARSGPLGGIEAGLAASDAELNLFVPVDAPELPREFLGWMMRRAERSHAVATIPHYGDRPQPLCAVYSRRLLAGLQEALTDGHLKVMTAIKNAAAGVGEPLDEFDVESVAASGPESWEFQPPLRDWFGNVNTPGEFEALAAASPPQPANFRRAGDPSGANRRHPIS